MEDTKKQAKKNGFVETMKGRKIYLPNISHSNFQVRSAAERTAINAPIQGTAADILKIAMLQIPDALTEAGLSAKMLLQVHDELVFECPENETIPTASVVRRTMADAYPLNVPLLTEAKSGPNWYDMSLMQDA